MTPTSIERCMIASEYGRFADTYSCIKTAFHDTDILADILAIVECGLYATVCVGKGPVSK